MPNQKISDLDSYAPIQDGDLVAVVDTTAGVTKKSTFTTLVEYFGTMLGTYFYSRGTGVPASDVSGLAATATNADYSAVVNPPINSVGYFQEDINTGAYDMVWGSTNKLKEDGGDTIYIPSERQFYASDGTTSILNLMTQMDRGVSPETLEPNTSGILDDSATFNGYTIGQIVAALRNYGLLA